MPDPRSKGRSGRPWRRFKQRIIDGSDHCHWCGRLVDKTLSGNDPMGPVVDHGVALIDGGAPLDEANGFLFHRVCNQEKENQRRLGQTLKTSREW